MGRRLRSQLDLLHPDSLCKASATQDKQQQKALHQSPRNFNINDKVYARNYYGPERWVEARVIKATGPVSYVVETRSGTQLRRHIDQLCKQYPGNQLGQSEEAQGDISDESVPIEDLPNWQNTPGSDAVPVDTTTAPMTRTARTAPTTRAAAAPTRRSQ